MALIHIDTSVALIQHSHGSHRDAHSATVGVAPRSHSAHAPRLTLVAVAETCLQLERLIMRRGEVYKSEEARYRDSTVLCTSESHNTYTILHDMQLQMARHRHT